MGELLQPTHLLVLGIVFLFLCAPLLLLPKIFYILTIQKTLQKCAPATRQIDPGLCWLFLIPFFAIIWHFFMMNGLTRTLAAEFARRGIPTPEAQPGHDLGLAMCIAGAGGVVPGLGGLAFPTYIVLWIIYWLKISEFSRQLDLPVLQPTASATIA